MDPDQSEAGQELDGETDRTPEQLREEIAQTRAELGDTVAALAEKTDVKGQAKQAVAEAKATVSGKVAEVKETVTGKKDGFVSSARQATPESAGDAGQRVTGFVQQNAVPLTVLAAFALGLLIGRRPAT